MMPPRWFYVSIAAAAVLIAASVAFSLIRGGCWMTYYDDLRCRGVA